jgi:hypothetical protein
VAANFFEGLLPVETRARCYLECRLFALIASSRSRAVLSSCRLLPVHIAFRSHQIRRGDLASSLGHASWKKVGNVSSQVSYFSTPNRLELTTCCCHLPLIDFANREFIPLGPVQGRPALCRTLNPTTLLRHYCYIPDSPPLPSVLCYHHHHRAAYYRDSTSAETPPNITLGAPSLT